MKRDLVTIATGAALALTAAACADPSVTQPFTLSAPVGVPASATSAATLDAAPGYSYTFQITSIRLNASLLGTPVQLDPVTFGDVTPAQMTGAGTMASLPSMFFSGHYDSSGNVAWPTGFNFDVTSEALASGALRTTLTVNSLGRYTNTLLIPSSVTVTGTASAQVIPAPAASAALLGAGLLAVRRRRT